MRIGVLNAADVPQSKRRSVVLATALLCVALGLAGLAFRIAGMPGRVFWSDEAVTAMRVSGHTSAEFTAVTTGASAHPVSQILRFAGRGDERGVTAAVRSLALEDAQHPPVYYVITALWTRVTGASIAGIRLPALIFGLLVPFAAAWLCWELYASALAAALGFGLTALSPVLVIYSLQAREYSAWSLAILVMNAVFLRASRTGGPAWWIAYAVCAGLSLYTAVLSVVTIAVHAAYAAVLLRGKRLGGFIAAGSAAILVFLPWAAQIYVHRSAIVAENAWTASPWPLTKLLEKWAFNAGTSLWDLEYLRLWLAVILIPIGLLVAFALVWSLSGAPRRARIFAAASLAVPAVTLLLPDVVLHQHRSSVTRYEIPLWIALLTCLAGFLACRIRTSRFPEKRASWAVAAAIVLGLAAVSSFVDTRSSVWWDNRQDGALPAMAEQINTVPHALIVVPRQWPRALDLAFYLDADARIEIPRTAAPLRVPRGYDAVYLIANSADSRSMLQGHAARAVASSFVNAQVAQFQGAAGDPDALTLWLVSR